MSPSDLIATGEKLYGNQWKAKLAAALGVDVSTLRRWTTGQVAIPRVTALAVENLLSRKHKQDPKTNARFEDGGSV